MTAIEGALTSQISAVRINWPVQEKFLFSVLVSQMSFNLFCLGDKTLLSEFLRKWGRIQGHNNISPNILAKNQNFPRFCRWKSTDNNNINIFLSLENPCTFLLGKEKTSKRIFNIDSELLQNRTEKQIKLSKTTINFLFNNIWCCLFITFFDWKIVVFQQTIPSSN